MLDEHHALLRTAFATHDGVVVDTQGDSFFVVFRRAQDAVEAALAAQRSLQTHVWPEGVRGQAGISGWAQDYPTAGNFLPPLLTCKSFVPRSSANHNLAEFCNPRIDAEIARARALEVADPGAASRLWTKVDHDIVQQAPLVFLQNSRRVTLVSRRVHNYQYNPQWGVLLDQLWVR